MVSLPESGTVRVLVDAYGRVPEDAVQTTLDTVETWLDPAEPFYMGWLGNGRPAEHARFEQVYDARIDADGLSFSFIPNGDSRELFGGFFPAATTIPSFETSFDPDRRVFTLRLHNTCLESGGADDISCIFCSGESCLNHCKTSSCQPVTGPLARRSP